jgi:hypothetical protein
MRILGILAIVVLSWVGQPAFAHAAADFVASAGQGAADAAADFDWILFNLRLKLAFVFCIMAAIAGLAHLANRSHDTRQSELARVRIP